MRLALNPMPIPFLASHPSTSAESPPSSTSSNRGERLLCAVSRNVPVAFSRNPFLHLGIRLGETSRFAMSVATVSCSRRASMTKLGLN